MGNLQCIPNLPNDDELSRPAHPHTNSPGVAEGCDLGGGARLGHTQTTVAYRVGTKHLCVCVCVRLYVVWEIRKVSEIFPIF